MTRGVIRKCPCCGLRIRAGALLCPRHRRLVPVELLQAVNKSWQAYKRAPYGWPAIFALQNYQRDADAAVQAGMVQFEMEREAA